jgi:hypothetical protein
VETAALAEPEAAAEPPLPVEELGEDVVAVAGDTVTLRHSFLAQRELVISGGKTFVVPRGITLDLSSKGSKGIILADNAVFNVEGTVYVAPVYNATIWIFSAVSAPAKITGNGIIHLDQRGRLLYIGEKARLILENITLDGLTTATEDARGNKYPAGIGGDWMDNNTPLVVAQGELEMRGRATITGNTNVQTFDQGGGIAVNGGRLTMNGSSRITGNTLSSARGVDGGGLYINHGTVVMNDQSSITGNLAEADSSWANGGGVRIWRGSLTMNDGARIADNTASGKGGAAGAAGGGVHVADNASAILIMNGGVIENNRVSAVNRGGSQLEVDKATAQYGDGTVITRYRNVNTAIRGRR